MRIRRLAGNPIIHPGLSPTLGSNINGPSLIRVPAWIEAPLRRYYLYFADHKGSSIRLAIADDLEGPWRVHGAGVLQLADTPFLHKSPGVPATVDEVALARPRAANVPSPLDDATAPHIASPEAHVNADGREIRLYYHGLEAFGIQVTRVAVSVDGLHFEALPEVLARPYFRVFRHAGYFYGMAMPGTLYRSRDGLTGFEEGPTLFTRDMRHAALLKRGNRLHVFWTRVGDAPERILVSVLELTDDWTKWRERGESEVLRPERSWEGADLPIAPSVRSAILVPANQLRDPAIHVEGERTYLLYSVAGEGGIAIAEIELD